jgi:putative redox protein
MKIVTVDWQPERATFEARGGHPGQVVTINAPHEGAATGFSASELLLASAGSCSAWDVVEILRKQRQRVSTIEVRVEGDQSGDAPWAYEHVRLTYTVTGHRLNLGKVRKAVELSERRYCAVIATIRGVAEVTCMVDVHEADAMPAPDAAPELVNASDTAVSDATA